MATKGICPVCGSFNSIETTIIGGLLVTKGNVSAPSIVCDDKEHTLREVRDSLGMKVLEDEHADKLCGTSKTVTVGGKQAGGTYKVVGGSYTGFIWTGLGKMSKLSETYPTREEAESVVTKTFKPFKK